MLDEVQKTCSHVAILKEGEKLFSGKVNEVLNISDTVEISSNNLEILELTVKEYENATEVKKEPDLLVVKLKGGTTTFDLNNFMISKGIVLSHLSIRKKSLERQFLELLTENE